MKKCCEGMCRMGCPALGLILFSLLGLWFTLSPFGIPTMGEFWSWFVLVLGLGMVNRHMFKPNDQNCPMGGLPLLISGIIAAIGGWYVLADLMFVPQLNAELLHIMTFLIPLKIIVCKSGMMSCCGSSCNCGCSPKPGSSMNH